MTDEPDPRKLLVFEESRRALDDQQSVLDGLRSRTGVLVAAGAVSSTFLGGQALAKGAEISCWSWAALVAFAAFGIAALVVLAPWRNWRYQHSAATLKTNMADDQRWESIDGVHERMAEINEYNFDRNKEKLDWMFGIFLFSCAALIAEIGFWLIELSKG